jgi:lysophospholipase L1-like esterase
VIGDSLTTQIRQRLVDDQTHRWVLWSRCGATVQTALDAGAARSVRAAQPDVVIVALGTNDSGFPTPHEGSSAGFAARQRRILDQLAGVPCVVWMNTGQAGDPVLQGQMDTVNDIVRASGARVFDWGGIVRSEPGLLLDRVHLAPGGQVRRVQALAAAVGRC